MRNASGQDNRAVRSTMPAKVARWGEVPRAVNMLIDSVGTKTIREPRRGLSVAGTDDESLWIFGMDWTTTTCTVYTGKWYFNGAWRTFAENTITLSGSESYVYVGLNRTSLALSLKQSATLPTPTADEAVLVIAHFTASGSTYSLTKRYWRGAYYAEAPTPA